MNKKVIIITIITLLLSILVYFLLIDQTQDHYLINIQDNRYSIMKADWNIERKDNSYTFNKEGYSVIIDVSERIEQPDWMLSPKPTTYILNSNFIDLHETSGMRLYRNKFFLPYLENAENERFQSFPIFGLVENDSKVSNEFIDNNNIAWNIVYKLSDKTDLQSSNNYKDEINEMDKLVKSIKELN